MNKITAAISISILIAINLLTACTATTAAGNTVTVQTTSLPAEGDQTTNGQNNLSTSKPVTNGQQDTLTATFLPETSKSMLQLVITDPRDGAYVSSPVIAVTGTTEPGAAVSVNDGITLADEKGTFTMDVTLEPGPNLIEIIASNDRGDEISATILVTLNS
jgi:hypothetical protein